MIAVTQIFSTDPGYLMSLGLDPVQLSSGMRGGSASAS